MAEPQPDDSTHERRIKLSVVIITKNEEDNIRRCLESVKWVDDIVVVDQFSTDRTVEICTEYTDNIYQREMTEGFGPQKQFAVEKARCDWVFSIDADEWLSPELRESLESVLADTPEYDGYEIMRRTSYLDYWVNHCGWYVPILRLFDRGQGRFNDSRVHEMVIVDGRVGRLEGDLLHKSYRDIHQHLEKLNLFTDFDAQIVDAKGIVLRSTNYLWYFAVKPFLSFLRKYFLMKGYKDGVHGFIISLFTALAVMFMHVKAWQIQETRRRKHMVSTGLDGR